MTQKSPITLSKRERQIMDILYRLEAASAAEVQKELPDPPGYSATRALLGILVNKGHAVYSAKGNKYIYRPKVPKRRAGSSALSRVLNTFYEGSLSSAVASLVESRPDQLSPEEVERLAELLKKIESKSGKNR